MKSYAHLVGIATAGLDFEPAARHFTDDLVVFGGFARTRVKTDGHPELLADRPDAGNHAAKLVVVRVGNVFLEAEGGSDEVDGHPHLEAKGEHDRGRLGSGEAGKLVDGKLAKVLATEFRGEGRLAGRAILVVANLHFLHGGPNIGEQAVELVFSRSQTRFLHSSTSSVDKVCRNILGNVHTLFNRTFGHLGQCKLGRNVESDVTGKEATCYQLIFPDVELAPDGLVVGVETPGKTELVETALQLG